jgi:hypothetical protein
MITRNDYQFHLFGKDVGTALPGGARRGGVGSSGAIDADSDGEIVVVVYSNGRARRYDATSGAERGSVGTSGVVGCNVSGAIIILRNGDGKSRRYGVRSGAHRGGL